MSEIFNCVTDKGKLTGDSCFGCKVKSDECDLHKLLQEKQEREWIKFETEIDEEDGREIFCCPMPEDEQEVLITDGKNVWLDMFCNDGNECWFDSGFDFDKITHWQPLPEPPKEREENE